MANSSSPYLVPSNRVVPVGTEVDYLSQAVASGALGGDHDFTRRCEGLLAAAVGSARAMLTPSCTAALEMAAILLDTQTGDEVIVPAFTFTSTATAFVLRGAVPRFADVRPDTLNLDESRLESLITARTRAIVVVHYAGVACEMDPILEIAARHGVAVIEDNAHGLFGTYRGRQLGALGSIATLSFHETKNFTCGEGGAILINQADLLDRAEIVREKGTNRLRFFRGEVDRYTWVDLGSSFLPSELQAAYLLAQLEAAAQIQTERRLRWDTYLSALTEWAKLNDVRLPVVPDHCGQTHHIFHLLLPEASQRARFIAHLRERGVQAVSHYVPLNLSEMGLKFGGRPGSCPVSEDSAERLLRLPLYHGLTEADQETVITAVGEFRI